MLVVFFFGGGKVLDAHVVGKEGAQEGSVCWSSAWGVV